MVKDTFKLSFGLSKTARPGPRTWLHEQPTAGRGVGDGGGAFSSVAGRRRAEEEGGHPVRPPPARALIPGQPRPLRPGEELVPILEARCDPARPV